MQVRVIREKAIPERRSGTDRRRQNSSSAPERRGGIRRVAERVPEEVEWYLAKWQEVALAPEALFGRIMDRLATVLARAFAVDPHDVAVLLLKDRGQLPRLAYPPLRYQGRTNLFPVWISSIDGEVLATRKGRIDNDVARVPYLDIYERICRRAKRPLTIQRMVTAPLLLPSGELLGVIQVSRRGQPPTVAADDFPPYYLLKLRDMGQSLAPYIHGVLPANF